ncbi:hypothetical protein RJ640_008758 [Escallonia rubra]|uniref:tRNA synthetases class I (E and Q) anti-codon binding domain-containing protein n=1 Tax=Escallonia rubra TaxID=112253 RepID=A0AA88QDP9_9ASTE|nr:hypothetical protein RJ640_008758 [Escallonia rubra]
MQLREGHNSRPATSSSNVSVVSDAGESSDFGVWSSRSQAEGPDLVCRRRDYGASPNQVLRSDGGLPDLLDEDEDFLGVLNPCTKKEITALGDSNMRNLKRGETLQLERKGYFIYDAPFVRSSKPIVLFAIPDGRQQSELK